MDQNANRIAWALPPLSGADFTLLELPLPALGNADVLVQVKAIGLNPIDYKTRIGVGVRRLFNPQDWVVPGWDIAGVVVAAGASVTAFRVGDAVLGMLSFPGQGGAYASHVVVSEKLLVPKPDAMSWQQAAALPLASLTALQAIQLILTGQTGYVDYKNLAGKRVLVHAAAGGVGHLATQILRHYGAEVVGTGSKAKHPFMLQHGVDLCLDYEAEPFENLCPPVDHVLDCIGGEYISRSLQVMKPEGSSIVSIVSGKNQDVEQMAAAVGHKGYRMVVKPDAYDLLELLNLVELGALMPAVAQTFDFTEVEAAHQALASGKTAGKLVVTIDQ